MNLANTAPVRMPWGGLGPEALAPLLLDGGGFSFQLSFDLSAPVLTQPSAPPASPWMPEARDNSRHGAELAALLVILQPEAEFLPLAGEDAPPAPMDAWPPLALPGAMIPPPEGGALLPGPEVLAIGALAIAPIPPAPDWLLL